MKRLSVLLLLVLGFLPGCADNRPFFLWQNKDAPEGTVKYGEMITIPAGNFLYSQDKIPFFLPDYKIDKTEVTIAAYNDCITAGVCTPPYWGYLCDGYFNLWGSGRPPEGKYKNHPVSCVTQDQANIFCRWAGKRLPTAAEWEKAARGTDGRMYPWGEDEPTCERAVMFGNGSNSCGRTPTWPVCSKTNGNSPYGVCDMAGNVYEWIADKAYSDSGIFPIVRGGSWYDQKSMAFRTTRRGGDHETDLGSYIGFRCIQ